MAKFKGRKNPITRDAGAPKVRAARQEMLKDLRAKEVGVIGKKTAFDEVVKMSKLPRKQKPKKDK